MKWEWVCVYDDVWSSEGSFSYCLPPQRWRRRALARRRWCPARPHPHHLLGSTSRASCAMTSPLATTMGSALVKAARYVHGGGGCIGYPELPGQIRYQGSEQRGNVLCVGGHPSGIGGGCFAPRWLIDWVRPGATCKVSERLVLSASGFTDTPPSPTPGLLPTQHPEEHGVHMSPRQKLYHQQGNPESLPVLPATEVL